MSILTTATVLICALSTPSQNCTPQNAMHYTEIPLACSVEDPPYRPSAHLPAADSDRMRAPRYYVKTICAPPAANR